MTGDYVKKVKIVCTGNRKQIDGQRCDLRKLCIMIVSDKHDSESMRQYIVYRTLHICANIHTYPLLQKRSWCIESFSSQTKLSRITFHKVGQAHLVLEFVKIVFRDVGDLGKAIF